MTGDFVVALLERTYDDRNALRLFALGRRWCRRGGDGTRYGIISARAWRLYGLAAFGYAHAVQSRKTGRAEAADRSIERAEARIESVLFPSTEEQLFDPPRLRAEA